MEIPEDHADEEMPLVGLGHMIELDEDESTPEEEHKQEHPTPSRPSGRLEP